MALSTKAEDGNDPARGYPLRNAPTLLVSLGFLALGPWLATCSASPTTQTPATLIRIQTGTLYVAGHQIPPPFAIDSSGARVVVNGVKIFDGNPIQHKFDRTRNPKWAVERYDLRQELREALAAARSRGEGTAAIRNVAVTVFRRSGLVRDVVVRGPLQLRVIWAKDGGEEDFDISEPQPKRSGPDRASVRELVSTLETELRGGGAVLVSLGCVMTVPRQHVPKLQRDIAAVRRGVPDSLVDLPRCVTERLRRPLRLDSLRVATGR